jgi:ankyrin repeat protein
MSFFRRLSTGFKSADPGSDSSSPAPQSSSESTPPELSAVSDSPSTNIFSSKVSPFEFWNLNLTVESVNEAKSKLLDLNAKDPYGETALIRAARHGDSAVTKALVDAGADTNMNDRNGETALSWAAQMGKTGVLKILLDCPDVNLSKLDKGGRSALYDACCCQFR